MKYLLTFFILSICFFMIFPSQWIYKIHQARRRAMYLKKGQLTMFDVRQLIIDGEKDLAVLIYGELFKTNYKKSLEAVESLEKSIREKDSSMDET